MDSILDHACRAIDDASACRLIEPGIETGHPWFERHAIRGGKEIFAFTHNRLGQEVNRIAGCQWRDLPALRAYYVARGRGDHRFESEYDGFVCTRRFDSWEAAEAWLRAKETD
jgi:hypothetical protein